MGKIMRDYAGNEYCIRCGDPVDPIDQIHDEYCKQCGATLCQSCVTAKGRVCADCGQEIPPLDWNHLDD